MKLLFLDVDGVLNAATTQGIFEERCVKAFKILMDAVPDLQIVLSTTWRYKESSVGTLLDKLKESGCVAPDFHFWGYTPNFNHLPKLERSFSAKKDSHNTRTDEILLWLKYNTIPSDNISLDEIEPSEITYFPLLPSISSSIEARSNAEAWGDVAPWISDSPVVLEQFVILDDMNLSLHSCYAGAINNHFIRTPLATGLSCALACTAIDILNSSFDAKNWRQETYLSCNNATCAARGTTKKVKKRKYFGFNRLFP